MRFAQNALAAIVAFGIVTSVSMALAETIQLHREGGTYLVPVRINGALTLDFVLDTGASAVTIPADVFLTLLRAHTVSQNDFLGSAKYVLADGTEQESKRFLLHEVTVGNHSVSDVVAMVAPVQSNYPLLGQSFLSNFASWSIDNKREVLILSDNGKRPEDEARTPNFQRHDASTLCGHEVNYSLHRNTIDAKTDRLIGVWTGFWNNARRLCGALVVESVAADGSAEVIYVYGPSTPGSGLKWKQQRLTVWFGLMEILFSVMIKVARLFSVW